MTNSKTRITSGHIVKMPTEEVFEDVKSNVYSTHEGNRHVRITERNHTWSPSKTIDVFVKKNKKSKKYVEFEKKEEILSRQSSQVKREKQRVQDRRLKSEPKHLNSSYFDKRVKQSNNSKGVHPNKITKRELKIKKRKVRELKEMKSKAHHDEYLRNLKYNREERRGNPDIVTESGEFYGLDVNDEGLIFPFEFDEADASFLREEYYEEKSNPLQMEIEAGFGSFDDLQNIFDGKSGLSTVRDWVVKFKPFEGFPLMNKQFASCMAFLWQLYRASHALDYATAVSQFVLNLELGDWDLGRSVAALTKAVDDYFDPERVSSIVKTESLLDMSEGAYTFLNLILSSELVDALKNILISVTSFHLFEKDISRKIYYTLGKPPRGPLVQVIHGIFTSILTLMRCGEGVVKGVPVMECLFAPEPVTKLIHETKILESFKGSLYVGLPSPGKMCLREFVKQCSELLENAKHIKGLVNPYKDKGKGLANAILSLESMLNVAKQRVEGGHRPTPYGIIFHGPPGIGKSKLVPFANDCMARVHGRTTSGLSTIFAVEKDSDFMEGYDPYSHPTLFYSEMGVMAKTLAARTGDSRLASITSMVDSLPKIAPMAFEDKGKIYVMPELVIGDTNNEGLNLKETVFAPAAVQRRFTWIRPVVKPEFCKEDGVSIDPEKSKRANSDILDRWYFDVYTVSAMGNSDGIRKYHLKSDKKHDIYDLRKFLITHMTTHVSHEHEMVDKASDPEMYSKYDKRPNQFEEKYESQHISSEMVRSESDIVSYEDRRYSHRFKEICTSVKDSIYHKVLILKHRTLVYKREVRDEISNFFLYARNCAMAVKGFFVTVLHLFVLRRVLHILKERTRGQSLFVFTRLRLFFFVFIWIFLAAYISFLTCLSMLAFVNGSVVVYGFSIMQVEKMISSLELDKVHDLRYLAYMLGVGGGFDVFESRFWAKHKKALMAGVMATGTAVVAFKLYSKYTNKKAYVEMSSDFFNRTPISEIIRKREDEDYKCAPGAVRVKGKGKNIWENNIRHLSEPCSFTNKPEGLANLVWKNVRRMRINETSFTHCIGLCKDIILFNRHAVYDFLSENEIVIKLSPSGLEDCENVDEWRKYVIKRRNLYLYDNDTAFCRLPGAQFRDITMHFSPDDNFNNMTYGIIENHRMYPHHKTSNVTINHKGKTSFVLKSVFEYDWDNHRVGACGIPLIIQKDMGSCVAGIHVGSSGLCSFAIPLKRSFVREVVDHIDEDSVYMPIVSENSDRRLIFEDPARKSPFLYEKFNGLKYYGKDEQNILMNLKSKVVLTPIANEVSSIFLEVFGYESDKVFGPPVMKPFTNASGEYISPYNLALGKIARARAIVDEDVTDVVLDVLVTHTIEELRKRGVLSLSPNTMEQAINGILDDDYMDRMNASTSAGYGYPGKKGDHVPIVNDEGLFVKREATPQLMKHIVELLDLYDKEESAEFVYSARLKDEAREQSKIKMGKTRVFYMSPITGVILARMFLSPFYTLMVEFGDVFCTAIGVNMHTDADKMIREMKDFSEDFIEGDYGNFDQTMPFGISLTASTAVYRICEILGYSEKALKVVRGLLADGLFPWVEMLRDIFVAPGLQVSGKVCTAEDNSWKGLIMLMYAWYKDENLRKFNFFDGVKPLTYGDDVFAGVKKEHQSLFNNFTYKKVVEEDYGMTFTPADKEAKFDEFMNVHNVSFLKRKFVYNEEFGRWLAPLDKSAIVRAMTWHVPSAYLSKDVQIMDACTSMAWEVFLHASEKEYDDFRTRVIGSLLGNTSLERATVVNAIPLYGEIAEKIFS